MASRFRLPASGSPPISPAFDAGWENTASAIRRNLPQVASGTAFSTFTITEAVANTAYDMLHGQFISVPLAAQTISGTVKAVVRASENFASPDFEPQLKVYVVDNAGTTVRGTLLDFDSNNIADANEYATSLTNRYFPRGGAGTLSSLAVLDGDRIVVEIGTRKTNITNTSRVSSLDFGDSAGSDLADDQTSTARNNPWIEFSQTLVFQGVAKTLTPSYNVRKQIAQTRAVSYTVRKQIPKTAALSYKLRNIVSKTRPVSYNILPGVTAVAKTRSISYNVRKSIAKSRATSYTVRNSVSKPRSFSYLVRNRIQKSTTASYAVRAITAKQLILNYKVRTLIASSRSFSYFVHVQVRKSQVYSFQLLSARVIKSLNLAFTIKRRISKILPFTYTMTGAEAFMDGNELPMLYDSGIDSPPQYGRRSVENEVPVILNTELN